MILKVDAVTTSTAITSGVFTLHPPALIIGGMHRSGTSLVASLCHSAGLAIGDRLVQSHASNPLGHFEDLDFYRFHEQVLADNGRIPAGYDPCDVPPLVSPSQQQMAEGLITDRRTGGRAWGWKDPRTVLFLDFWLEMLPEAKYLFVFRSPWQVADSLHRRGDALFRDGAERALRLWHRYNAFIRDCADKHPERILVRSIDQFIAEPNGVFLDIRTRLGIPLTDPLPLYRPELFTSEERPTLRGGPSRSVTSACEKLYADLQRRATTGPAETATGPSPVTVASSRKRVAVVIPVPRMPLQRDEEISFRQLRHHLFAYDSILIAPATLDVDALGLPVRRFPDSCFTSVGSYNRLLLTPTFYDAFSDYEYILTYQLDCLVFSGDLDRWCDRGWDYVGAPWFPNFTAGPEGGLWRVGNGGFSLRRVDAFRRLLQRSDVTGFLEGYHGQEDVFWSFEAQQFDPGFRIPEPAEAVAFSIESNPRHCFELNGNALPFGCHYWNRIDRPFWEHFLAPGVSAVSDVRLRALDDPHHPDHDWARGLAERMLQTVAVEPEDLSILMARIVGVSDSRLNGTPSADDVEQAFQWLLSQPAPAEWLTWWVGKPNATLRQLYQDLIMSERFRLRQKRLTSD